MQATQPSAADLAAVRKLMGLDDPVNTESRVTALARVGVKGSTGAVYDVERRVDTVNGGTYTYCPCPGWKFSKSVPKACSHTEQAEDHWTREGI